LPTGRLWEAAKVRGRPELLPGAMRRASEPGPGRSALSAQPTDGPTPGTTPTGSCQGRFRHGKTGELADPANRGGPPPGGDAVPRGQMREEVRLSRYEEGTSGSRRREITRQLHGVRGAAGVLSTARGRWPDGAPDPVIVRAGGDCRTCRIVHGQPEGVETSARAALQTHDCGLCAAPGPAADPKCARCPIAAERVDISA